MDAIIKHILQSDSTLTDDQKLKRLDELGNDIELAKKVLKGEVLYCEDCDDYYLKGSFQSDETEDECDVCVYRDIINSGGNEYEPGFIHKKYRVCPKGHKHLIETHERTRSGRLPARY